MSPDQERELVEAAAARIVAFEASRNRSAEGGRRVAPEETADASLMDALGEGAGRSFGSRYYALARRALERAHPPSAPRLEPLPPEKHSALTPYARAADGSWRAVPS